MNYNNTEYIEYKDLSFFQKIRVIKRNFCNRLIIKLNNIILKCADKKEQEEVEIAHENADNFANFSVQFEENKEKLSMYIGHLKEDNVEYRHLVLNLYDAYCDSDFKRMESIFEAYGLRNRKRLKSNKGEIYE